MAAKNVAVEGDVQATAGTTPYPPADKGTWTAGAITYSSYDKLKIGVKSVVYQAVCTFTFDGTQTLPTTPPSTSPVSGSEKITLTAKPTKLQGSVTNVLVNGDSSPPGSYGNQLTVVTANKLLSEIILPLAPT